MHSQATIEQTSVKRKSQIIDLLYYYVTKGGVDTMDQMIGTFSAKRMIRRLAVVVFYNMMDISALNTYIICIILRRDLYNNYGHQQRKFLIILAKELAGLFGEERRKLPKKCVNVVFGNIKSHIVFFSFSRKEKHLSFHAVNTSLSVQQVVICIINIICFLFECLNQFNIMIFGPRNQNKGVGMSIRWLRIPHVKGRLVSTDTQWAIAPRSLVKYKKLSQSSPLK